MREINDTRGPKTTTTTTTTTILLPVDIVVHFDEREPAEKDERGDVSERVEFHHAPLFQSRGVVVVSFDSRFVTTTTGEKIPPPPPVPVSGTYLLPKERVDRVFFFFSRARCFSRSFCAVCPSSSRVLKMGLLLLLLILLLLFQLLFALFFAIHFSSFVVKIFRKKRMFLSQHKKKNRLFVLFDSHNTKKGEHNSICLRSQSETTGNNTRRRFLVFSMDDSSTRDALKAFVNREMSSVAVRSCCCWHCFLILFSKSRRELNFVKQFD